MPTLLSIGVSPRYEHSTSRKLTSLFVERWRERHPDGRVIDRDPMKTKLPFVDLPWIGGAFTPPEQHTPESIAAIKISDDFVTELKSANSVEGYNQASGYLRQVLNFIGITAIEIIMASRARAGVHGETAIESFGDAVSKAAA